MLAVPVTGLGSPGGVWGACRSCISQDALCTPGHRLLQDSQDIPVTAIPLRAERVLLFDDALVLLKVGADLLQISHPCLGLGGCPAYNRPLTPGPLHRPLSSLGFCTGCHLCGWPVSVQLLLSLGPGPCTPFLLATEL